MQIPFPPPDMTDEQIQEFEGRKKEFLDKYKELIDTYMVDFISYPVFMPTKERDFRILIQTEVLDKKYALVPSDFMK